jgi:hypothetical protein
MAHPSHFLTFRLPDAANIGQHRPCRGGCTLWIYRGGHVRVEGPSEEDVLDHALRFLRIAAKRLEISEVEATLIHPGGRIEVALGARGKAESRKVAT